MVETASVETNNWLSGVLPVLSTPFLSDGAVDMQGLRRLVDHVIDCGANAVTLFGIAGEFYKLSDEERSAMVDAVLETAAGRVGTIVSITRHATHLAVRDAREAEERGAGALMVLPPFFLNPEASAILEHVRAILEAVQLPVIVQYAPTETGSTLDPRALVRLRETSGREFYVKVESNPPGPMISVLHDLGQGSIKTLVGNGGKHLFDGLLRGAVGVMPGCALVKIYRAIIEHFRRGEHDEAFHLYNRLLPFLNTAGISTERYIYCEKTILSRQRVVEYIGEREPAFAPDEIESDVLDRYFIDLMALNEMVG